MTKHPPPLEPEVLSEEGFVLRRRYGKRTVNTVVAGAHRGAEAALNALITLNNTNKALSIIPHYVDPIDGRAEAMAEAARQQGLDGALGTVARIQDEKAVAGEADLVIHHLDRADAIAESHAITVNNGTPSLSYLAMLLPGRAVLGVAAVDDRQSPEASAQIQTFFRGVARVSARAGSGSVFGVEAPIESNQAEALIRSWFARHSDDCVQKLAAGVAPTRYPLEITFDGDESIPLFVVESDTPATSLEQLAESVLMNPHTPIPRGSRFVVCEVLPNAVRFVTIRHRSFGGVNVTGQTSVTDRDVLAQASTRRESTDSGLGALLMSLVVGASVLANATRSNALHTTD